MSSCVAQAGGDAIDGQHDHVAQGLRLNAALIGQRVQATRLLDLQLIERINVGVTQMHRAFNHRVVSGLVVSLHKQYHGL